MIKTFYLLRFSCISAPSMTIHLSTLKHSNFFTESFEEKKYSMMIEYNGGSKIAAKEGSRKKTLVTCPKDQSEIS